MAKTKQIVLIDWVDSSTINKGAWTYPDQIHPQPLCECISVGWIVRQDKSYILLAADETVDGPLARLIAIPRQCITKIKKLK